MMNRKTLCNSWEINHVVTMLIYIDDVRKNLACFDAGACPLPLLPTHSIKPSLVSPHVCVLPALTRSRSHTPLRLVCSHTKSFSKAVAATANNRIPIHTFIFFLFSVVMYRYIYISFYLSIFLSIYSFIYLFIAPPLLFLFFWHSSSMWQASRAPRAVFFSPLCPC